MNVRIQKSPIHGRGVFANESIDKGEWQFIYGELRVILPGDPLERFGVEWDEKKTFMPYAPWCCCNHGNEPNCAVFEYENNHPMMVIETLRDIEKDEELILDYGYDPSEY